MHLPRSSSCLLLLCSLVLVTGHAIAAEPAWTAPGSPPVAISGDGNAVLSDGDIFCMYSGTGGVLWKGYGGSSARAAQSALSSPMQVTGDGAYAILGTSGGLVYLDRWQKEYWKDPALWPVLDISLSPDENFIASAAADQVSVYTRGGELLWRVDLRTIRAVGVSAERLLTVASTADALHAYNRNGSQLWKYDAPAVKKILVSAQDSQVIAASEYLLLSLHPSGTLSWKYYAGSEIRDIAISRDGSLIVAGTQGGEVHAVDRAGNLAWKFRAGDWVNAVSVSGDGSLVAAGGNDRKVYLVGRDGTLLWAYATGSWVKGVALAADGKSLAAGADRIYYFALGDTPAPESPPAVTTRAPPAPAPAAPLPPPAPPEAPVRTPEEPPSAPPAPEETETPESASGIAPAALALALLIPGVLAGRRGLR